MSTLPPAEGHKGYLQEVLRQLRADYGSLTFGLLIDHAKAVRIPLLIIVLGVVLTFWVDQIHELFLMLMTDFGPWSKIAAWLTAGILGFAVWYTARTVYRFNIPTMPTLSDPRAAGLRRVVPRILGALIPLFMAIGTWTALRDPALEDHTEKGDTAMPWYFVGEALMLLVIFIARRDVFKGVGLAGNPAGDPRVNRWSQLPRSALIVYRCIFGANIVALLLAAWWPGEIATLGPLAVVLLCATFLTVSGTYLTIQAARWQFPLLSTLFGIAVLWQLLGWNDNHHVRLYPGMHSDSKPQGVKFNSAPIPSSLTDYTSRWLEEPTAAGGPVYVVSAEGGGIRASAWTAMVLTELEYRSKGEFSKHMLLGSGVSGGSLGLALFAAMVKGERQGAIQLGDLAAMNATFNQMDFLGPTLETMFLTDFLQRFMPGAWFIDRGERLESRWERGWAQACERRPSRPVASATPEEICGAFGKPWSALWERQEKDRIPLLFLNSTEVDAGRRFVELPLERIENDDQDQTFWSASTLSTGYLPATSPLSAVVHNSARFTYISPAGSLLAGDNTRRRQLVDGGYFENSATTTLAQLVTVVAKHFPACSGARGLAAAECPIHWIHISNDTAIESLRSDREDSCTPEAPASSIEYGEIRAPVLALVHTRDARATLARSALRNVFLEGAVLKPPRPTPASTAGGGMSTTPTPGASTTSPPSPATTTTAPVCDLNSPSGPHATSASAESRFYHFRLCAGEHHLPLGWNLSRAAMCEMKRQLEETAGNSAQLDELYAQITKD